jgi:hypothetical protein
LLYSQQLWKITKLHRFDLKARNKKKQVTHDKSIGFLIQFPRVIGCVDTCIFRGLLNNNPHDKFLPPRFEIGYIALLSFVLLNYI